MPSIEAMLMTLAGDCALAPAFIKGAKAWVTRNIPGGGVTFKRSAHVF
jgi:hypothetical protein